MHEGAGRTLAALGLCLLLGFAFAWVFVTLGMLAGNAQAAQGGHTTGFYLIRALAWIAGARAARG